MYQDMTSFQQIPTRYWKLIVLSLEFSLYDWAHILTLQEAALKVFHVSHNRKCLQNDLFVNINGQMSLCKFLEGCFILHITDPKCLNEMACL